jgi:hypothetical protein
VIRLVVSVDLEDPDEEDYEQVAAWIAEALDPMSVRIQRGPDYDGAWPEILVVERD